MIALGQKFPDFKLKGVVSCDLSKAFIDVDKAAYKGKWLVVFFWPKDFTFVCPTEIIEFGKLNEEFAKRNAQVLGASNDSEYVHLAWREHNKALCNLPFPMLADNKRELSFKLGIIDVAEGVAERATFIVDPNEIVRFVMVNDMKVGRNAREVLRVLDALQTDELCPCGWNPGEEFIKP
jgi:lipoyl-dependent peroxiredoxin subunit C